MVTSALVLDHVTYTFQDLKVNKNWAAKLTVKECAANVTAIRLLLVEETIISVESGGRHALWQLHDSPWSLVLKGNPVDGREERQLIAKVVLLHHRPNLLSCQSALQLLPTEELLLNLIPALGTLSANKSFSALSISAAETGCDEVSHSTALQKRRVLGLWIEISDEELHFLQANSDESSLGVTAVVKSVAETCPECHHILEGTTKLNTWDVLHGIHAEGGAVKELKQDGLVLLSRAAQGCLTKLASCNLVGHVGAHEDSNLVAKKLAQEI